MQPRNNENYTLAHKNSHTVKTTYFYYVARGSNARSFTS